MPELNTHVFFTIVIPTRERCDTLPYAIETALAQDYPHFEVLVCDNDSQDATQQVVQSINDPRLRYINTGERLSMSKNWEFAIAQVTREGPNDWVTILGDDDGLLPGALATANRIIQDTGTQAIRSNGCSYLWPGLTGNGFGDLTVSLKKGNERRESGEALQNVLDGKIPYYELPVLYNGGFVKASLIAAAKAESGDLFCSMTPDVYSGVIFSLLTETYVYCHEPLAINGASLHSGGTASFEKTRRERTYDPAKKFWSEGNIPFHAALPLGREGRPVRSISVLVYEAYLQASPFHDLKPVNTSHPRQLAIALRQSGPEPEEVKAWAESFAAMHEIRLPGSLDRATQYAYEFLLRLGRLITGVTSTVHVAGCEQTPIKTVGEATLATDAIKTAPPPYLTAVLSNNLLRLAGFK